MRHHDEQSDVLELGVASAETKGNGHQAGDLPGHQSPMGILND